MAKIKFIVRNANAEYPQTIYVTSRFGRNDKLMYALPLKCDPVFWDASRERVKISMYCPYRDETNEALDSLEEKIRAYIVGVVKDGGDLSKEGLVHFLDVYFGKVKEKATTFQYESNGDLSLIFIFLKNEFFSHDIYHNSFFPFLRLDV